MMRCIDIESLTIIYIEGKKKTKRSLLPSSKRNEFSQELQRFREIAPWHIFAKQNKKMNRNMPLNASSDAVANNAPSTQNAKKYVPVKAMIATR